MSLCVFCDNPVNDGQPAVTLRQKGCDGIRRASEERGVTINVHPGLKVHTNCRRNHCDQHRISLDEKKRAREESDDDDQHPSLRSAEHKFILIVRTAVDSASQVPTVVIGDDTDLLVLLLHHTTDESSNIFFMSEQKPSLKRKSKLWDIKLAQNTLGECICQNILFIHAILGCDTTSRLFGTGKRVALKKATENPIFCTKASIFNNSNAERNDIILAGEDSLVCLYGGSPDQRLDSMRYYRYCEKVMSSTASVVASSLPSTSSAAKYHSLRVYYQVQEWKGSTDQLQPQDWGWKSVDGKLIPIQTDKEPAPKSLLEVVRCSCKTGCSTLQCGCRKHGLDCSIGCGECRGMCTNSSQTHVLDEGCDDENLDQCISYSDV